MDYEQTLVDWMDGPGGYREFYEANFPAAPKTGGMTSGDTGDSGNTPPPPPPPGR